MPKNTTENGWEKEFSQKFSHSLACGLSEGIHYKTCTCEIKDIITFIQHTAKEEYERGRFEGERDVIGRIERMNIWSKGTAEGTKNDIIFKLHTLYPPLEAALETPNEEHHD